MAEFLDFSTKALPFSLHSSQLPSSVWHSPTPTILEHIHPRGLLATLDIHPRVQETSYVQSLHCRRIPKEKLGGIVLVRNTLWNGSKLDRIIPRDRF